MLLLLCILAVTMFVVYSVQYEYLQIYLNIETTMDHQNVKT